MEFKSLSVIKFPADQVWLTMRDSLHEIADMVDDLESITPQDRLIEPSGLVKVVNIWVSSPKIPQIVMDHVQPEMLSWTDTALWSESDLSCNWEIDSHYFREKMKCWGATTFESAIGGRGCRLTFQGQIEFEGQILPTSGALGGVVSKTVESVMGKMIPNNFRKLTHSIGTLINSKK